MPTTFQASKVGGDPVTINYTPTTGNVAAGDVVLLGNTAGLTCGIAPLPITNNVLGALEVGGGVYSMVAAANTNAYVKVWWDDANNKVTTTSTNNAVVGFTLQAITVNTAGNVLHVPQA